MPNMVLPGPPHSEPRDGVEGCTKKLDTNLPSLVKTWMRLLPRSQTYTRPSVAKCTQCSAGANCFWSGGGPDFQSYAGVGSLSISLNGIPWPPQPRLN